MYLKEGWEGLTVFLAQYRPEWLAHVNMSVRFWAP